MVWLRRVLLTLLILFLATQLINGLQAWRDEAVAKSWIGALDGKRECLGGFTTLEARRLESLATLDGGKLSAKDELRVECWLRHQENRETIYRVGRDLTRAQTAITDALVFGAATVITICVLLMLGRSHRRKTATRGAKSM